MAVHIGHSLVGDINDQLPQHDVLRQGEPLLQLPMLRTGVLGEPAAIEHIGSISSSLVSLAHWGAIGCVWEVFGGFGGGRERESDTVGAGGGGIDPRPLGPN